MKLPAMFPRVRDPLNSLFKTTPFLIARHRGYGQAGLNMNAC